MKCSRSSVHLSPSLLLVRIKCAAMLHYALLSAFHELQGACLMVRGGRCGVCCTLMIIQYVAGHALLDTSMCPGCTELQECVYFEYEYQCKCKTGYARTVAYGNGYVFNSPFIPSLGQSVDCIDLDECR